MNAAVLTIGDELLQGFTIDTNSSWLGTTLLPYNIKISKKVAIGDNLNDIISETQYILNDKFDLLFVTGGLGPTHDDITKEAFRQFLDDELIFDESYYTQLIHHFEKRSIKMPESNRSQAMLLKTADVIPNENGTALGMHILIKDTHTFIMPGVPGEMKSMVKNHILPKYIKKSPVENSITIKTAGIMESHLAEKVNGLMENYSHSYRYAFLPHYSGVSFRINKLNKIDNLQDVKDEFYKAMLPYAYGINNDTLEKVLGLKLIKNNYTIATAESCTGGLIGKRLTDTAGSSEYFLGSVTAYSNQLKSSLLNIPNDIINTLGAVNEEVALKMAKGVRAKTGADIGISTTGISGPEGGTKTKPVGLVYIGVVTPEKSMVKKYNFNYGRHIHREMTTTAALNITRLAIEKN
ncbi:MAG: CinA family nicotinamide mononucleotide deamidase-related protein [Candidatus Marinimicrobia bacterium]|nr:CinA family nicotinamide mononucleotide deamidase-related protein [Candidatus Neomarinimicrobiota bacterium]